MNIIKKELGTKDGPQDGLLLESVSCIVMSKRINVLAAQGRNEVNGIIALYAYNIPLLVQTRGIGFLSHVLALSDNTEPIRQWFYSMSESTDPHWLRKHHGWRSAY